MTRELEGSQGSAGAPLAAGSEPLSSHRPGENQKSNPQIAKPNPKAKPKGLTPKPHDDLQGYPNPLGSPQFLRQPLASGAPRRTAPWRGSPAFYPKRSPKGRDTETPRPLGAPQLTLQRSSLPELTLSALDTCSRSASGSSR